MNKKAGIELSTNTIVIMILVLIAIITIIFIFSGAMRDFASNIFSKLTNAVGLWDTAQSQLNP